MDMNPHEPSTQTDQTGKPATSATSAQPRPTSDPSPLVVVAIGAAVVVIAMLLLADHWQLAALQKMAGYTGKGSAFKGVQDYLEALRDSLIPLAIPLGAIGMAGGGVAYMVGNPLAQKVLGGVIIGLALALLGPSLIA